MNYNNSTFVCTVYRTLLDFVGVILGVLLVPTAVVVLVSAAIRSVFFCLTGFTFSKDPDPSVDFMGVVLPFSHFPQSNEVS